MSSWDDSTNDPLLDLLSDYYAQVGQKKSRDQLTLIVEKYQGREEVLFEQLEKRYNQPVRRDAPPDGPGTAPHPSAGILLPGMLEPDADMLPFKSETSAVSRPLIERTSLPLPISQPNMGVQFETDEAKDRKSAGSILSLTSQNSSSSFDTQSTIKREKTESSRLLKDMRDNNEEIKANIKKSLHTVGTITLDLYCEEGVFQAIAKNPLFENVTLGVIVANAVWMGIETDWNKEETLPDSGAVFQIMEHLFCAYFSAELFVRFMAFRTARLASRDAWFVFDSVLCIMMVSEDWILLIVAGLANTRAKLPLENTSILRLLRLLRLARLMRMLRSIPELMMLVKAMLIAITSVLYVMGLLVVVTYIAGIACTQLSVETVDARELYFLNVPHSMYSLIIYATLLDNLADFCNAVRAESIPVLIVVFIFMFAACLTLMNMLLGVLCEVISEVAGNEREALRYSNVSDQLASLAQELGLPDKVSPVEFRAIIHSKQACIAFHDVGVDVESVVDLAEFMFIREDGTHTDLTWDTFLDKVLEHRYENPATLRDIKQFWNRLMPLLDKLVETVEEIKEKLLLIEEQTMAALVGVQKIALVARGRPLADLRKASASKNALRQ